MRHLVRRIAISVAVLSACAAVVYFADHRFLLLKLAALSPEIPDLAAQTDEGLEAIWFDDYFAVFRIDAHTYAIGETRYHQANFNYLLVGTTRAILFDSGPGLRDIVPVVRSLTSLPVTSATSHLHYDHVGHFNDFEGSAMIDLPELRKRERNGLLKLTQREHLGFFEGIPAPRLQIGEWWKPGQEIDLGDRRVIVHHTPGHTRESMVLQDPERGQFFTGDTFYPGELYLFLPGSKLGEFLRTTDNLLGHISQGATLYGAHRLDPAGLPVLAREDIVALQRGLLDIRRGSNLIHGFFPQRFEVNATLSILMDFSWGRRWD